MNIEELKRLAEAATPGPWNTSPGGCGIIGPDKQWLGGMNDWVCEYSEEMTQSENNAAFIAAANPSAVLELIDYVEYLRGKNREHFDACTGCDEELKRVSKQRDELLSALKVFADKYNSAPDGDLGIGLVNGDFFRAIDAIAKVEG